MNRFVPPGAVLGAGLVYLCVAFIQWEINPGNWTEFARLCTAAYGLVGAFGGGLMAWSCK